MKMRLTDFTMWLEELDEYLNDLAKAAKSQQRG